MKKSSLFVALALFLPNAINARTVTVVDSSNNSPLSGVSVIAYTSSRDITYTGRTDNDGAVNFHNAQKSDSVRFSLIGYKSLLVPAKEVADTVRMSLQYHELGEIQVNARRELVSMSGDKMTYDVSRDSSMQSRSALDALRQAPLIMVDGSGNIIPSVGYIDVDFRMNGLRDRMLSGNTNNMLSAIKANNVKSIEVTTAPTVDGPKLVVNIVTKGRLEGLRGELSSDLSDDSWANGLFMLSKVKRLSFSASYYNTWLWGHTSRSFQQEIRPESDDMYSFTSMAKEGGYHVDLHRISFNLSYNISDNTILSLYGYMFGKTDPHSRDAGWGEITDKDGNTALSYTLSRYSRQDKDREYQISASLQSRLAGGSLFAEYEFYNRPVTFLSTKDYDISYDEATDPLDYAGIFSNTFKRSHMNYATHSAQIEWEKQPTEKSNLKLTAKARHLIDDSKDELKSEFLPQGSMPASTSLTSYKHAQTYGLFEAMYEIQLGRMYMRGALDGQFYDDNMKEPLREIKYNNQFFNVIPSALLSYGINGSNKLTLNYYMRKNVPNAYAMSPFVDTSVPGILAYGNPELKPETLNQLNLSYTFMKKGWELILTSANRLSRNLMLRYNFMDGEILHETYGNIANRKEASVSAQLVCRSVPRLFARIFFSGNYVNYSPNGTVAGGNSGWYANMILNANYNFGKGWYLYANGGFNTKKVYFQSRGGRNAYYGLSLSKGFFNNELEIGLIANNFMNIHYRSVSETSTPGYRSYSSTTSYHASFEFSLKWHFGKLKAKGPSVDKRISNRDIKSSYKE